MGLLITLALGVFVLLGAAIAGCAKNKRRITEASVAVALGAIAMLLAQELLPETLEGAETIGIPATLAAIAAGVALLAALERFLPESPGPTPQAHTHESALHVSVATTIALSIHNIVEGMSVYSLSSQSISMAAMLAFGIGAHNVPMGMLVYTGIREQPLGRKAAVLGAATLSTFAGGLVMFAASSAVSEAIVCLMVALTVGLLLYIVIFELIPQVVRAHNKLAALLGLATGAALVFVGALLSGE